MSRRTKLAPGIWQDAHGISVVVRVGHEYREPRYPLGTSLRLLKDERDALRVQLRAARGTVSTERRTLAQDVPVYLKARAAMEMPVDNVAWPDLFERQERILFICLALVCQSLFGASLDVIPWALWLLALLTHVTAVQRFLRAKKLLQGQK